MALIIEDGTGVTDSNSYDTLANAQAYFDLKGTVIVLTEESLINATQYIDTRFAPVFIPVKKAREQSLEWPRYSFTANDGYTVAADIVPIELKRAMYESAKLYIDGADLFSAVPEANDNLQSLTQTVEGAVSEAKTWFSPTSTNTRQNIGQFIKNIVKSSATQTVRVR